MLLVILRVVIKYVLCLMWGAGWGSRIRYSIKNVVLIRDSISEISP